jgi:peroxiredoxin
MRTVALILTGLLTTLTAPAANVPRPSPELAMERYNDKPIKLSQYRGKTVALAFTYTTCEHCQYLTRTLKVIQKDYAARNVQVLECAFNEDAALTMPMVYKTLEPTFPIGIAKEAEVKKYLLWNDRTDGILYVPYMIFIDAAGTIRGDYSGKDGFFNNPEERIRAVLDKMVKPAAKPAAKKK